jgi:ATP-dependent helicase IRC3
MYIPACVYTLEQAHYEKKAREAKKIFQLAEKERRRKERETVQVGPLVDHEAR